MIDIRSFQQKTNQETALKLSAIGLQLDTSNNSHQTPYQLWELSASNDLHHWSVISNTSLVQLHKDGHSLIQDKIPVNIGYEDYAYLKLRCTDFCSDVQLSAISIFEESTTRPSPADIHWTLKGEASSSKAIKLEVDDTWQSKAIWEFAREDFAPIEKFSIYLGAQNYGGNIRLLGRAQSQSSWQLLYEGIWFNTQVGDKWYSSAPPILNAQDIREFRLELAHPLQTNTAPDLVLYTTPRAIQFIGNQNPPYQLWVSAQADMLAQARILNSLLNNQSPVWAKHQWEFLNSPKPNNQMQPSWKSLVFWGLLMIAVTLLALMAIKLFKQMNTPRD